MSATPGPAIRERGGRGHRAHQPTHGLIDPEVEVRPVATQVDDLEVIRERVSETVLVTTLTKRMSEDLTEYSESWGSASDTSTLTSTPWRGFNSLT